MARPGLLYNLHLEKPDVTVTKHVITIRYKEYMYRLQTNLLVIYRGTISFIIHFGDVIGVDLFVPDRFIFAVRSGLLTEVMPDGTVVLIKPLNLSGTFDQRIWQLIHECLIRHFYRPDYMARPGLIYNLTDVKYRYDPPLYTISKGAWKCYLWMSKNCLVRALYCGDTKVQAILYSRSHITVYHFKPIIYFRCNYQFEVNEMIANDWDKISGLISWHLAIAKPGTEPKLC